MVQKTATSNRITKREKDRLNKKLRNSVLGIVSFIVVMGLIFRFFGPEVGALFGLISQNRNKEEPKAELTLTTPTLIDPPKSTNKESLLVEGASKPGSTVKLFLNGPEKEQTLTGTDGKFMFDNINLIKGRNTLFVKAYGDDGEESDRSITYTISLDSEKPRVTLEKPIDGEEVKNLDGRVLILGSVNEKSKITVNERLAVLRPDNTFEYLLGVSEGKNTITVTAEDEAGNKDEKIIYVTYKKQSP